MVELAGCYTDKERQEIEEGVRLYDAICRTELEKEKPQNPFQYLIELYREFENIGIDSIRTATESIGLLSAIREQEADPETRATLDDLIKQETTMIELRRRDIVNDRKTIAGFRKLPGRLSGSICA